MNSKEKKCIFLLTVSLKYGGQERFVSRLTSILKDTYNIKLILFDDRDILYPYECDMICLNSPVPNELNIFRRILRRVKNISNLRKLIKTYHPEVCISFGDDANRLNCLSKVKGCKAIINIRGYAALSSLNSKSLKKIVRKKVYEKADKIICVSSKITKETKELFPLKKDMVFTLYNAYDCNQIINQSNESINIGEKKNNIISVGTMRKEKGYWHLIKAFSLVKKELPNMKLYLVGAPYMEYGHKLQETAKKLGISDSVIFTGLQNNPYKYIRNCCLYVMSSVSEGFPNALVESMVCGTPVISVDCKTGPREILCDRFTDITANDIEYEKYGVLVPQITNVENYDSEDIESCDYILANAIIQLLKNSNLLNEYSRLGKIRAASFSYEHCRDEIVKIIES